MRSVRFEGSVMWKRVAKSKLKNVGFTQTGEVQTDGLFWRGGYSMDVFYGYRERHYWLFSRSHNAIRFGGFFT